MKPAGQESCQHLKRAENKLYFSLIKVLQLYEMYSGMVSVMNTGILPLQPESLTRGQSFVHQCELAFPQFADGGEFRSQLVFLLQDYSPQIEAFDWDFQPSGSLVRVFAGSRLFVTLSRQSDGSLSYASVSYLRGAFRGLQFAGVGK